MRAVQTVFPGTDVSVVQKLKFVLGTSPIITKLLRLLINLSLGNTDTVDRQFFKTFLEWFSPLSVGNDFYENSNNATAASHQNGYDIDMIADIVSPNWFFGFMTAAQAKEILSRKPYGAFLFRFSSNAGCYALSVNYGQVGHWRIMTEKAGSGGPVFRIDGKPYRSLHHVIETHSVGGEPLAVKDSSIVKHCFLKDFCDRTLNTAVKQAESLYENFG